MKKNIRFCSGAIVFMLLATTMVAQNSVLSTGNWYKIAVENTGIHKITYNNLMSYGINPGQINPKLFRLYGNGNGMLPEPNDAFVYDDLQENAIFVYGENDEVFDPDDYILFYGEGSTEWKLNEETRYFEHQVNIYSDFTYYFINVDIGTGKRIEEQYSTTIPPTYTSVSFNDYCYHELELENLIHSGREWYGERFEEIINYNFQIFFTNLLQEFPVHLEYEVAARSTLMSNMYFLVNDILIITSQIQLTPSYNTNIDFAKSKFDSISFNSNSDSFNLLISYDQPTDSSIAWLDYFAMNARCNLIFEGGQLNFRDIQSAGPGMVTTFILQVPNENILTWNITDPLNPKNVNNNYSAGSLDFTLETDSLLEFMIFDNTQFYTPLFAGQIENQNLHGMAPTDFVIVSHTNFLVPAQQLANFRESHDGISSTVISPDKIYNEFSSGSQDIIAIRDFVKFMYEKSGGEKPKNLLLFGDASFDYKDKIENNTNYIPVWESPESLNPIGSFCTDDYFGIFQDDSDINVGIGRLPVKTIQEAEDVIQKIIQYSSEEITYGSWRNEICLIADDEDNNLHLNDTETIAEIIDTASGNFNISKIYLDTYQQQSTPEGYFYPEVNQAIIDKINEGVSIISYVGHGNYERLAAEQIYTTADLAYWENNSYYPLLYASTCDFARFDDPEILSLAEKSLLFEDIGMIAIISTTRYTYAGANAVLQKHFFLNILEEPLLCLGQIISFSKNQTNGNESTRKQILFGDPSMKIAIPILKVITEAINGQNVLNPLDTVSPGEQVIISGYLVDQEGYNVYNFNGNLHVKVFDRADTVFTLGNDSSSFIIKFMKQDSILLEMDAEVLNGQFAFIFNLPYEMNEEFGTIKISYYAKSYPADASGHFSDLVVGGQASSINDIQFVSDYLLFYPTLVNDYLNYTIKQDVKNLEIEIFNITGTKVNQLTKANYYKGANGQINLAGLSKGIYIIRTITDKSIQINKIIKL